MEWDVVNVKDFNFEVYLISANVILITDVKLLKSLTPSVFFFSFFNVHLNFFTRYRTDISEL